MLISYDIYKDMQIRFDEYVEKNNTDPERIFILPGKSESTILTHDLKALAYLNPDKFPIEYNTGENPIESKPDTVKSDLDKLRDKFGYFDTICNWYDNVVRKCDYAYYYNQSHSVRQIIDTLLNDGFIALNCTDWSLITSWIAKELGYPFRVYNVVCSSGAGHVRPAIQDRDNLGDWMSTDPAAIADKSEIYYACLFDVWCDTKNGATIVDTSDENQLLGWMHW
ncbi:MAG: hypothetical protein LBR15_01995 [Methanobrevibacter sp.]|nr:hypothetical protein [Candidatus Methanovirga australis]